MEYFLLQPGYWQQYNYLRDSNQIYITWPTVCLHVLFEMLIVVKCLPTALICAFVLSLTQLVMSPHMYVQIALPVEELFALRTLELMSTTWHSKKRPYFGVYWKDSTEGSFTGSDCASDLVYSN